MTVKKGSSAVWITLFAVNVVRMTNVLKCTVMAPFVHSKQMIVWVVSSARMTLNVLSVKLVVPKPTSAESAASMTTVLVIQLVCSKQTNVKNKKKAAVLPAMDPIQFVAKVPDSTFGYFAARSKELQIHFAAPRVRRKSHVFESNGLEPA
mmetsp:Transcript_30544/g.63781  ORF Transcript_30544/g.63781 Transcript_30544/m.63781 type:complete len:150 (+) Transcript_30544:414-863(+)